MKATTDRPTDAAGFPIGTRWVRVDAYDKDGKRIGHCTVDVVDAGGSAAQANSNATGSLVRHFGAQLDTIRVSWGD